MRPELTFRALALRRSDTPVCLPPRRGSYLVLVTVRFDVALCFHYRRDQNSEQHLTPLPPSPPLECVRTEPGLSGSLAVHGLSASAASALPGLRCSGTWRQDKTRVRQVALWAFVLNGVRTVERLVYAFQYTVSILCKANVLRNVF